MPSSFHVVQLCGTIVYIDKDARREIESFLRSGPSKTDFITVESVMGEEVTIIAEAVSGLWDCTPETRAAQREISKMFKDEAPLDVSDL